MTHRTVKTARERKMNNPVNPSQSNPMIKMDWIRLDWMDWIDELDWIDGTGLDWIDSIELDWNGLD